MDAQTLIATLAIGTLALVAAFALWSRQRTRQLQQNPTHEKSTLAAVAPDTRRR